MILEQLNPGACKTYLVASEATREAMLVDPLLDGVPRYEDELERRGLTLRWVLDTHVHADHVSGAALLQQRTGASYLMHERSVAPCVDHRVKDGETMTLGDLSVRFLHTPGHTADSVSVLVDGALLTGDFLFIGEGGAGRTDLPGGDASEHWDALQKLSGLPDALKVYPGHDYHGRAASTLGAERAGNPRLKARSRDRYVAELQALSLEPAEWMKDVIAANYDCATTAAGVDVPKKKPSCEVGGTRGDRTTTLVKTLTVSELARELQRSRGPTVVDVREPEEFNDMLGHIAGARLIPLATLAGEAGALRGLDVVTVCRSGSRSATAAALLAAAGVSSVRSLQGGMLAWNAADLPIVRERATAGAAG